MAKTARLVTRRFITKEGCTTLDAQGIMVSMMSKAQNEQNARYQADSYLNLRKLQDSKTTQAEIAMVLECEEEQGYETLYDRKESAIWQYAEALGITFEEAANSLEAEYTGSL